MNGNNPIVFFDGNCGICDRFIRLILLADKAAHFRFAALQGSTAQIQLPESMRSQLDTIVLKLEDSTLLTRSDAVAQIFVRLGGAWTILGLMRFIPRSIRDSAYRLVARYRHRIFPAPAVCKLPSIEQQSRFLP